MAHLKGFHKDRSTNFTSKQEFRQKKKKRKKKDEVKAISGQQSKHNLLLLRGYNMT
jgi:hypothetical protein